MSHVGLKSACTNGPEDMILYILELCSVSLMLHQDLVIVVGADVQCRVHSRHLCWQLAHRRLQIVAVDFKTQGAFGPEVEERPAQRVVDLQLGGLDGRKVVVLSLICLIVIYITSYTNIIKYTICCIYIIYNTVC